MKFRGARTAGRLAAALGCVLLAACGKPDPRVYNVPRENPSPATTPTVSWRIPDHWKENYPGGMRFASFTVPAGEHPLDLAVTPIPDMRAGELENVNRWRNQVGLGPVSASELEEMADDITVGEDSGRLFDMTSEEDLLGTGLKKRILVAAVKRPGNTWYFKLTGEAEAMGKEKESFLGFLESVSITAPEAPAAGPSRSGPGMTQTRPASSQPEWKVPEGWQEAPGSSMRIATFRAASGDAGSVEISVTKFPGDVGGLLANIGRWRGQVGLPPIAEGDVESYSQPLAVEGEDFVLVDTHGHPKALDEAPQRAVVVLWRHHGETWFFKMIGDTKAVAGEKSNLVEFVKSVRHPEHG